MVSASIFSSALDRIVYDNTESLENINFVVCNNQLLLLGTNKNSVILNGVSDNKAQRNFEFDNEKRIARFMPGREDSYERLLEEGHLQFGSEDIDVESLVLRRESIRCLQRAMQLLTQADMELLRAIYYQGMTERQFAKKKSIHYMTIHNRKVSILHKLKKILENEKTWCKSDSHRLRE